MNLSSLAGADPVDAATRLLRIGDHAVKVVSGSPESAELMAETFYPPGMQGVEITSSHDEPDLTIVDVPCDHAEVRTLLDSAADGATTSDYELTRGFRQPRYDYDDYTVFTLRDANSDEVAAVIRADRRAVIVRPRSRLGDRWLTRLARDIATRLAIAGGSLILHSSAFVYDGRCFLVIGDSGAGKSTTAIALARLLPSAGWMGNDRIHVQREDGQYRVTACPLPLAINKGSLDVMGVTDFAGWDVRAGMPAPGSDWDQFHGEDKLKLSSREVERHLGVRLVPTATLAGVLLPRVDLTAWYACGPASPEYAAEVIERNCFSLDDNLYGEDWLQVPVRRRADPPSLDDFLADLAKLPVLRCTVGNAEDLSKLASDLQETVRRSDAVQ
jgi:hypothetical protein